MSTYAYGALSLAILKTVDQHGPLALDPMLDHLWAQGLDVDPGSLHCLVRFLRKDGRLKWVAGLGVRGNPSISGITDAGREYLAKKEAAK